MNLALPSPPFALGLCYGGLLFFAAGCGDDGGADAGTGASTTVAADTGSTAAASSESGTPATGSTAADGETGSGSESTGGGLPGGCWGDLPVGETQTLYQGFSDGSEGIAFGTDGLLYVTTIARGGVGTVWQLDATGTPSEYATVPTALGLAPLADGSFIVASFGVANQPDGAVYIVDPKGTPTEIATGIDSPNFVTITPAGEILISDDFDTRVFRVQLDGSVEVILADVPSPNGMAYSPDGQHFYVASTFTEQGQLTRYEVGGDGFPIEDTAVEIMHLGPGSTPDGIAVDEDGFVYVAANLQGSVWRVDGAVESLTEGELISDALGSPASLAFGHGPDFDPCSLYVTQLFADQVLRLSVGVAGAPLYR